jgi:dTDP-4-dehydrorhamnose 3,5-epimerase
MSLKVLKGPAWLNCDKAIVDGPIVLEPTIHGDPRGYFVETWQDSDYGFLWKNWSAFVQDNESMSDQWVFRGLHYQVGSGQAKLVRVVVGSVVDFVVDVREGSPTFGACGMIYLSDVDKWQVYIPVGFAHGFLAMANSTVFAYKVDAYREVEKERGVRWDDPEVGIMGWMAGQPWFGMFPIRTSMRDNALPVLKGCDPFKKGS